jgi:hypothetical protein
MTIISAEPQVNEHATCEAQIGAPALTAQHTQFALVALSAFCLYWFSSSILAERGWTATQAFGADSGIYGLLAKKKYSRRDWKSFLA